jgi:CHAT domain-containing protein
MVSDQPITVDLMKYFYSGMLDPQQHLAPVMALQEAQKQVLLHHPGLHPRYWAAFTIEGEYQAIAKP